MLFSKKIKDADHAANCGTTIIGAGVTLTGDINSTADIRIDGTLKGNIVSSARILVGSGGVIEGDVQFNQADILGKIKGNIKTNEILSLRGDAIISGDIFARQLQVEPSVNFNGRCYMNNNVVGMVKEQNVVEMLKEKNEPTIHTAKAK